MARAYLTREHGTERGYHQHNRDRVVPCAACLAAHGAFVKRRRDLGRCKPGPGLAAGRTGGGVMHCGDSRPHAPHTWYSPTHDPRKTGQQQHQCPGTPEPPKERRR